MKNTTGGEGVIQFNNENDKLYLQHTSTNILSIESDQVKIYKDFTANSSSINMGQTATPFNNGYFTNGYFTNLKVNGGIQNRWMASSNTITGAVNGNQWGSSDPRNNDSYPNSFGSSGRRKVCDTSFATENYGVFTFSETGTYNIRVQFTAQNLSTSRTNVALYFSIDNDNSFPIVSNTSSTRSRMGVAYCRDVNNVASNTASFGDYVYLQQNQNFRCKCLIEGSDADSTWDDRMAAAFLDVHVTYEFEKIADTNVISIW